MFIKVSKTEFVGALNKVGRAIGHKSHIEAAKGIKLATSKEGLELTANNTRVCISTIVEAEIVEPGELVILSDFIEMAKKMPDGILLIQTGGKDNEKIELSSGTAKFATGYMSAESFPGMAPVNAEDKIIVDGNMFRRQMGRVLISTREDDTARPELGGVLIENKKGVLEMTSLDGCRISHAKGNVEESDFKLLVDGYGVEEAIRVLPDEVIEITPTTNCCLFEGGMTKVSCRLLDESRFFDCSKFINGSVFTVLAIDRDEFLGALERGKLAMKQDQSKAISLDIEGETLKIGALSKDVSYSEEIAAKRSGEGLKICFNVNYLIDGLKQVSDDEANLYFANSLSPAYIKTSDYTYMMMPIRHS